MGEPTVDELIRHLQTELGQADDIIDSLDRKRRMLQLETSIQEALSFQQRYNILEDAGIDPIKIAEAVRLIQTAETAPAPKLKNTEDGWCESCEATLEEDLDFCPACGKKV
jgi:hypothetical protein